MSKGGQVTVFIIIGLLIVLGGGLAFYMTGQDFTLSDTPRDEDAQRISEFVGDCLTSLGTEAVEIIGLQGGYIYVPQQIRNTRSSYIDLSAPVVLPYWYYEGENRVPPVELLQGHINRYVEENLGTCLDNFSTFGTQYDFDIRQDPAVTTIVGEEDVQISLAYPMLAYAVGKELKLEEFRTELPVKLGLLRDMAEQMMEYENSQGWFENFTMDMVAIDPEIPLNELSFDCSPKRWRLIDIAQRLQTTLQINAPRIRTVNTDTVPFREDERVYRRIIRDYEFADIVQGRVPENVPEDMYEFGRMQFDPGLSRSNLRVAIDYNPSWGMSLNGFPNDNGVISSRTAKGVRKYLSFLCLNMHHVTYDIIFPLRIAIVDPDALEGRGYRFQFAFPVIINNNVEDRVDFGYREFRGFEQAPEFCETQGNDEATFRIRGEFPGYGLGDLPEVDITLQCVTEECPLGQTRAENGIYQLQSFLPEGCANPMITAKKDGYVPRTEQLLGDSLVMELTPLRKLNVNIVKVPIDSDPQFNTVYPSRELRPGQAVTLHVERIGSDQPYEFTVTYPEQKTIELIDDDASYSIEAILSTFDDPVGGHVLKNWTVEYEDIAGKATITIPVYEVIPATLTDEYTQRVFAILNDDAKMSELEVKLT